MDNNIKIRQIEALLGSMDKIVSALSLEALSEETQLTILKRFSDIVFKRILLRVPQEYVEEVKRALTEGEDAIDMDAFAEILERAIPNSALCIQEEIENAISEFQPNTQV
ncbi:MAG: hypothetical protein Q7S05_00305 [bacterium]|nr:hypothetical protein [bacterium]